MADKLLSKKMAQKSFEFGFKQGISYATTSIKMELVKKKGYENAYKLLKNIFIKLEKEENTMDRVIKFRGKRVDNGEWVYGYYEKRIFRLSTGEWSEYDRIHAYEKDKDTGNIIPIGSFEVIPSSVGQFTGFTDCEGKEIYEGDIVQLKGSDYEVYFQKDCGQWLAQDCFQRDNYNTLQLICYCNKCKIIGNIHDKEEAGK